MITVDEVRDFGTRFFNAVASGASAAEQAQFFLDPHARIYIAWNGATIRLEDHEHCTPNGSTSTTPSAISISRRSMHRPSACGQEARSIGRRSFRVGPRRTDQGRRRRRLDYRARGLRGAEVRALRQHLPPFPAGVRASPFARDAPRGPAHLFGYAVKT